MLWYIKWLTILQQDNLKAESQQGFDQIQNRKFEEKKKWKSILF